MICKLLLLGTELTDHKEPSPPPPVAVTEPQIEVTAQTFAHIDIGVTPADSPKRVSNC